MLNEFFCRNSCDHPNGAKNRITMNKAIHVQNFSPIVGATSAAVGSIASQLVGLATHTSIADNVLQQTLTNALATNPQDRANITGTNLVDAGVSGGINGYLNEPATESSTAPPLSFAQDMAQRIAANPISAYEHAASLASANQSIDNWSTQAMGFGDNANSPRSEVTVSANPIGGLLGKAGKAVLASVADGLSLVMDTASYAGQAVYPHEVIPESSLGKLVANDTISFTDKLKTVGFGALGMVGNALKGDPEAVGGLLGSIISDKLVKVPEIVKTEVSGKIAGADGGRIAANSEVAVGDGLAFRSDLPGHMIGPDGFTKSGQLSGTHNLNNATTALDAQGATYSVNPTSTPGISELQYTYTNSATGKSEEFLHGLFTGGFWRV